MWRITDQLGKTVVRLDTAGALYHAVGGVIKLASLVFDHPLEGDQFSSLSSVLHDLAVGG